MLLQKNWVHSKLLDGEFFLEETETFLSLRLKK